jgi:hypothetical protein
LKVSLPFLSFVWASIVLPFWNWMKESFSYVWNCLHRLFVRL